MADSPGAEALCSSVVSPEKKRTWCMFAVFLFGGAGSNESVATRIVSEASAEFIWRRVAFYEEVPGRPPFLLDALLCPIATEGDKSQVGATILCRYKQGTLVKRITAIRMPCFIRFDVLNQQLGIEHCAIARGGSYCIRRLAAGSEVVLTTNYRAFLHPRWLWRPLERLAVHQLHTHILNGVRKAVDADKRGGALLGAASAREEQT